MRAITPKFPGASSRRYGEDISIQAVQHRSARVRILGGVGVDRSLDVGDESVEVSGFRSGHSRGRHHSGPQLQGDLLERFRVTTGCGQVDRLQREIPEPHVVVVAGDAVVVDQSFAGGGGR